MYPIFAFLTLVTPGLYDILANFQSLKTTLLRLLCESSKQAVFSDFLNFPTFYMGSALPLGLALFIYIKVLFYEIIQHPLKFDYITICIKSKCVKLDIVPQAKKCLKSDDTV